MWIAICVHGDARCDAEKHCVFCRIQALEKQIQGIHWASTIVGVPTFYRGSSRPSLGAEIEVNQTIHLAEGPIAFNGHNEVSTMA